MNSTLQNMADGRTPFERCEAALEPVVRRLMAEKMPADAIIAALAGLSVLAADQESKH